MRFKIHTDIGRHLEHIETRTDQQEGPKKDNYPKDWLNQQIKYKNIDKKTQLQ